jgi:mannose-6-phosphate isomerase-like protein (cupin superfamily)
MVSKYSDSDRRVGHDGTHGSGEYRRNAGPLHRPLVAEEDRADQRLRRADSEADFTWHKHDDTDELFLVLRGELTIQMRDREVVLGPGDLFVVPQGAEHCPRAAIETAVLLLEPSSVINTGDAGGTLTAEVETLP